MWTLLRRREGDREWSLHGSENLSRSFMSISSVVGNSRKRLIVDSDMLAGVMGGCGRGERESGRRDASGWRVITWHGQRGGVSPKSALFLRK